jgi:hypothetical protein
VPPGRGEAVARGVREVKTGRRARGHDSKSASMVGLWSRISDAGSIIEFRLLVTITRIEGSAELLVMSSVREVEA